MNRIELLVIVSLRYCFTPKAFVRSIHFSFNATTIQSACTPALAAIEFGATDLTTTRRLVWNVTSANSRPNPFRRSSMANSTEISSDAREAMQGCLVWIHIRVAIAAAMKPRRSWHWLSSSWDLPTILALLVEGVTTNLCPGQHWALGVKAALAAMATTRHISLNAAWCWDNAAIGARQIRSLVGMESVLSTNPRLSYCFASYPKLE
jgi:hypothetical protein